MVYLNYAAADLGSDACVQAITEHLRAEMQHGPYVAAQHAGERLQQLYAQLAAILHCAPADLALTTGNSHAWNSVVSAYPWQAGDQVVITSGEWGGNVAMLSLLQQRLGIEVLMAPHHANGALDLSALQQLLAQSPRVRMLCLTWVPAHGALVYPAQDIGALCRQHGVAYVIDAAQAAGHLPVDVQKLQCDALTAPGRKWLGGPRGTGVLYVHPRLRARLQPSTVDHRSCPITEHGLQLRSDMLAFEAAEHAVALRLGWHAALQRRTNSDWAARYASIARQGQALRAALRQLPHLRLHDVDDSAAHCGIASFSLGDLAAPHIQQALAAQGIQVAVHAPGFTPGDSAARQLGSVVRVSVSEPTCESELKALTQQLAALA